MLVQPTKDPLTHMLGLGNRGEDGIHFSTRSVLAELVRVNPCFTLTRLQTAAFLKILEKIFNLSKL